MAMLMVSVMLTISTFAAVSVLTFTVVGMIMFMPVLLVVVMMLVVMSAPGFSLLVLLRVVASLLFAFACCV